VNQTSDVRFTGRFQEVVVPLRVAERSSLTDRVTEQLRSLIESGEWPVGQKIPAEPVLADSLEVGRNTVREAVRALVHTGMLEPRQGDGTYVRAADDLGAAVARRSRRANHLEVLEVRCSLERDAARLAALRSGPEDVVALRAALARRDRALRGDNTADIVDADLDFHRAAVQCAHNTLLTELYSHLTESLRDVLVTVMYGPGDDEARFQSDAHTALVEAIAAGDPDAAGRAVTGYLTETEHLVGDDPAARS
jgi:DNA-binding FadR family transcriptional regulator